MSAWIWLYDETLSPYVAEHSYRFEVETIEQARAIAATAYPDAPRLAALVVIDCGYADCLRRLMFSEDQAKTISEGRALAAHPTAFYGGWYQGLYRGRQTDICQWHYEVDPDSRRPLPVGTLAGRRAAEAAAGPVEYEQPDLFGGAL